MNPIETAVLPLKVDAIAKAEQFARATIANVLAELEVNDWNLDIVAPYPPSNIGRFAYAMQAQRRYTFGTLTAPTWSSKRPNDPDTRKRSEKNEARFIEETRENAAAQYDAFVAKLCKKIGETVEATLEGSHVWGYSFLRITKADGTRETWKTQQIVNVSKLGKVFNQWPSRKVKA